MSGTGTMTQEEGNLWVTFFSLDPLKLKQASLLVVFFFFLLRDVCVKNTSNKLNIICQATRS